MSGGEAGKEIGIPKREREGKSKILSSFIKSFKIFFFNMYLPV